MKTILAIAFALVVLVSVGCIRGAESADEQMVNVKLREYIFHIPESYSMRGKRPFWLNWISGLDDSSAMVGFKIPREELSNSIPGYRSDIGMFATLEVLTNEDVACKQDARRFADRWFGQGSFEDRRVESLGQTGWYRVYHPLETQSWEVFRQRPGPNQPLPDDPLSFFVARCHRSEGTLETTSCLTYAFFDRIAIDFSTNEENLLLIDEIRTFLEAKVLTWKQPGRMARRDHRVIDQWGLI